MPPFSTTPGMPASAAFCRAGPTASGVASVTAMPSTSLSIAFWTSVACLPESGSLEYFSVDAVLLGCLLGAGADPVPERGARVLVGDHRDGVARAGRRRRRTAPGVVLGAALLLQAVTVSSRPAIAAVASFRVRSIIALSVDGVS